MQGNDENCLQTPQTLQANLLRALSSLELVVSLASWFGVVDFATSW
jgi:hypothetical protein